MCGVWWRGIIGEALDLDAWMAAKKEFACLDRLNVQDGGRIDLKSIIHAENSHNDATNPTLIALLNTKNRHEPRAPQSRLRHVQHASCDSSHKEAESGE